jgi:hypothetical protein
LVSRPAAEAVATIGAAPARQHPREHGARGVDVGHDVDVPGALPDLVGSVGAAGDTDAGVGAEHVDDPVFGGDGADHRVDLLGAPDVDGGRRGRRTRRRVRAAPSMSRSADDHARALGGEAEAQGATDAARSSRDHRNLAGELHGRKHT